jgi:hypothetical protein
VSVFKKYFLWRNADSGWTGTSIGKVGFDGFVSVENGVNIFESRETRVSSWNQLFINNSLFVDYTGLYLGYSITANDQFDYGKFTVMGGPCCQNGGLLLPWNSMAGGGLSVSNCTWVNFQNPCIRYSSSFPSLCLILTSPRMLYPRSLTIHPASHTTASTLTVILEMVKTFSFLESIKFLGLIVTFYQGVRSLRKSRIAPDWRRWL